MKIFTISALVIISVLSILTFINRAFTEHGNPDIIISYIKITPSSPTSSSVIRAAIKCKNIGSASIAPEIEVTIIYEIFKEEIDNKSGEKKYILVKEKKGTSFINFAIAAGGETIQYSFSLGKLKAGNYRIDFTCDAYSLLKEVTKSNNTTSRSLIVSETL